MRLFLYFFALLSYPLFSQNILNAVIEYKKYNNGFFPNTLDATVFVNNTITIYNPKTNTKVYKSEEDQRVMTKDVDNMYFMRIDHSKQEILFFDRAGGHKFLVEDTYYKHNWNISNETQNIGGYECTKATMTFRDTNWIVWFTPEIPLPYGPWKLYGLPGLIIEAYDDEKENVFRMEKIKYEKDSIFNQEFKTLVKTKNKEPIFIRKLLEMEEEFIENANAQLRSKGINMSSNQDITLPNGKIVKSRVRYRLPHEKKYEWEE
ncbi:GLPGLI family protein [Flavobacterium salilacus subsp. salilacus]|uniref:GLPGLI family protein n=1 Tax=Flavobacterium TaxID=237 RepID=UPI001075235D|nr:MULTISPECIES: GLPGLI family protein [Flavobacterium]KAF2520196.1 GLPGLI family protein [Flavobacterium salilacus subsp. salilacus]MBE1613887.1 GLPGLI family protein [Flavobacterium sp. SaA2.13]